MENNSPENITSFEVFNNTEDLAASMNQAQEVQPEVQPEVQQEVQQEVQPEVQPEVQQEVQPEVVEQADLQDAYQQETTADSTQQYSEPQYTNEEIETAVFSFLSERLGREVSSIDDLTYQEQSNALDERVEAIARFVNDTGRSPEDWFRYQSLNPEGMDDMTAVRINMANEYPNLSYEELNLLVGSKYKLDPDSFSESEVKLAQLQLKIDGDKARRSIAEIRNGYSAPVQEAESNSEMESLIDDRWISDMSREVDTLTGLEFDLGENQTFEFSLDDQYKIQLKDRNARLDEFFDPYVRQDGSWDYDKLSSHIAVLDNIDKIVKSAYTKGLGDGQRTLVNTAANVSTNTPKQGVQNQQADPLAQQLKNIMSGTAGRMTFNI